MAETIHSFTAALAEADPRAVESFYRRYFNLLYAQARRATGRDESFCLDVVQESVLRVLRSVRPAHSERQFKAWLALVVQTTAYDLLRGEARRRRRERLVAATVPADAGAGAGGDGNESDEGRLRWLATEIAAMDRQIVRIIEMRFNERWTLARIAQALGLTIGTIDGRLRALLVELRRRAAEEFDE